MEWDAHADYIRCIVVHPTKSLLLSASDDMTVKSWDFEKGFKLQVKFEGHSHYVMSIAFNPRDGGNTFATGSLDGTVRIWSIASRTPNYSLDGHGKGVNAVDYYRAADKPYLCSVSDDMTIRVWDYQNKSLVRVIDGHLGPVTSILSHGQLPLLVSASEDGSLRAWNASTFQLEASISDLHLERLWAISVAPLHDEHVGMEVAVGGDLGLHILRLGKTDPVTSLDVLNGKLAWAKGHTILTSPIRPETAIDEQAGSLAGVVQLSPKELGQSDIYPTGISYAPNGRWIAVWGDGQFVVYSAVAWRNKAFGRATDFAWSASGNDYVVRDASSADSISVSSGFGDLWSIKLEAAVQHVKGGELIAALTADAVYFLDWQSGELVRAIEVDKPSNVWWSKGGKRVAVATAGTKSGHGRLFVLSYGRDLPGDDRFTVECEQAVSIRSGCWLGDDAFVFADASARMQYVVLGSEQLFSLASGVATPKHILGYLDGMLICADKDVNVSSVVLPQSVIAYQAAIVRGQLAMAERVLASVPSGHRDRLARFLADFGLPEQALAVAQDSAFRFELALKSGGEHILTARDIAEREFREGIDEHQWRALACRAVVEGRLALAMEASQRASDWPAVLLLQACTSATGKDDDGSLASKAREAGHLNVSIAASLLARDYESAWHLLGSQGRHAEAAFFARTYLPHRIDASVAAWRAASAEHPVAQLMADISRNRELFDARVVALSSSSSARPREASASGEEERAGGSKADRSYSIDYTVSSTTTTTTIGGGNSSSTSATNTTANNNPTLTMEDSISMEVNTTGTGSIRADDLDDIFAAMKVGVAGGAHSGVTDVDGDENAEGEQMPLQGRSQSRRLFPHPEEDEMAQLAGKDQRNRDNPPPQANLTDDDCDNNNEEGGNEFYDARAQHNNNTEDEDALMADMEAEGSAWSKTH